MSVFTVIRSIGRGGFGIVEEVQDRNRNAYARKTFSPAQHVPHESYESLKKRFLREVRTQQVLGGNEILPVLASGLGEAAPWFTMPLADRTYDTQIREERASKNITVDPLCDIINGLSYLHSLGYVHRDLNPKNVLLHDGYWKLADFGAVLPPSGHTVTLTEDTLICTERYCAPEQRHDFHTSQPAADIYSFGCILHDLYGTQSRIPYARHTAVGPMGPVIEKCTENNPQRRPSIALLRELVIEAFVECTGLCKVEDAKAEEWLAKLVDIVKWKDETYNDFARFFADLQTDGQSTGRKDGWLYALSTPFLTRIPAEALARIVSRRDGVSASIIEKYCGWVRNTAFQFGFADIVCSRLAAIFDHGAVADKAMAFTAMIHLGESHNRWHVMRSMLLRCSHDDTSRETAVRLSIEIRTEEMQVQFNRCIGELKWDINLLAADIRKLCS